MRSLWFRLATFLVASAALVVLVAATAQHQPEGPARLGLQLSFLAIASWLLTFVFWPRRREPSRSHPSQHQASPLPEEPAMARDDRPVLVIGDRPAGSSPGAGVHPREATGRASRGRRPGPRPQGDITWPGNRRP